VQIGFTHNLLTVSGGAASAGAKCLERVGVRHWVQPQVPVQEHSPNAKGIWERVLALWLTCLTGGTRFSPLACWGHGLEALQACLACNGCRRRPVG